jgi:signal transduction histidine kinase/ActR/RegA family two-component response regulator
MFTLGAAAASSSVILITLSVYLVSQYRASQRQLLALQTAYDRLKQESCPKGCVCSSHVNFRSVLSHVAHEIKNPAQSISSCLDLLLSAQNQNDTNELLAMMRTSSADLIALISNILEASKLQDPMVKVNPSWVTVGDIMESLKVFSVRAEAKGLRFGIDMESYLHNEQVFVDRIRVVQVLSNFVSNAIKFTSSGHVTVHVRPESDELRFDVVDSGIGIEPAALQKIFEPFVQASSVISSKYGGNGLGLAISKQIATMMEARLEVQSQLGSGSMFSMVVPLRLRRPSPIRESKEETLDINEAGLCLSALIIEDNAINRKLLSQQLKHLAKKNRIRITSLDQFSSVEEFSQSHSMLKRYDLALLDLHLEGVSGPAAVRQMKQITSSQCGLVAVTGSTDLMEMSECMQAGVDHVLHKPYDQSALERILWTYRKPSAINGQLCKVNK